MDGDQGMIKYYLSRRGKKRGYTTGTEISGPDGGPLEVIVDVRQLSDDELQALVTVKGGGGT
jgi:hypothetical protein